MDNINDIQYFVKESLFEQALVDLLPHHGWEKEVLVQPTEDDLIQNWAKILFDNNRDINKLGNYPLTASEMRQIIDQVNLCDSPYAMNMFINGGQVCIKRDNPADTNNYGKEVYLKIFDAREISAGQSRYQIARQPRFKASHPLGGDRRGDVMLLINGSISERLQNVITESWHFMKNNRKARSIMIVNALIGAVSTLVLFFLQAKLPLAGLNEALLGPALFVMGLGAALGAKVVGYFPKWKYKKYIILSGIGALFAFAMTFSGNPYLMVLGGFAGSFADDFLEVRTDILLNDMIPSEQRATLISVNSFTFSLVMIVMSTLMGSIM